MLKTLTVWNFALIEHIKLEFGTGLNILTGETGAGKSILIDALGIILGGRANADYIRQGEEYFQVEAVFIFDSVNSELMHILSIQAIDIEDNSIIITRKMAHSGRSNIIINGRQITLNTLKEIAGYLVDIHGQHDNIALLASKNQYKLLDNNAEVERLLLKYQGSYLEWKAQVAIFREKEEQGEDNENRLDMLRWQEQEIYEAHLCEGEEEILEAELNKLTHAEKILANISKAYELCTDCHNRLGILSALGDIKKYLAEVVRYDDKLNNTQSLLDEAHICMQEAVYDIQDYAENMDFNPKRLEEIQERLSLIYKLEKKYGSNISTVLKNYEKIKAEIDAIYNYDNDLSRLQNNIKSLENTMLLDSQKLHEARMKISKQLSSSITEQIGFLGMDKAGFDIVVSETAEYSQLGRDRIDCLFSANLGEPLKPLERVASGGELSRIALAIKTVIAADDHSAYSMVFDEIDNGIGGITAQRVAERIAAVSQYKQVLCITHLPQIACIADEHFFISKEVKKQATITTVQKLSDAQRIKEIARMASGDIDSEAALNNAREMLAAANIKKANLAAKKNKKENSL